MNDVQEFKLFIEGVAVKPLNHNQSELVNQLHAANKKGIEVEITMTGRGRSIWHEHVKAALEQQATLVPASRKGK